jgi:hypothetical protein
MKGDKYLPVELIETNPFEKKFVLLHLIPQKVANNMIQKWCSDVKLSQN